MPKGPADLSSRFRGQVHPLRAAGGRPPLRFEILAALIGGPLLPMLETVRRGWGQWAVDFTTLFEDYVAGALLLAGGLAALRGRRFGRLLLLTAWAYATGLMSSSFWYQLEETIRGIDLEPHNPVVLAVKLCMWVTCVVALLLSFRGAMREASRSAGG